MASPDIEIQVEAVEPWLDTNNWFVNPTAILEGFILFVLRTADKIPVANTKVGVISVVELVDKEFKYLNDEVADILSVVKARLLILYVWPVGILIPNEALKVPVIPAFFLMI